MKTLNLTFEDEEFRKLEKARKKSEAKSWEKFVLYLIKLKQEV